ncbi:Cyclic pyranopterin phosphate synthase (MoaA) [hydrothermal vent metagenome]|uniref:GTP 3',8-cyclase n=1 Tax=hydrothermal vent metagenome TaxID=652676 RepID=A0A3B0TUT4_9ZZZZ
MDMPTDTLGQDKQETSSPSPLIDGFGRHITYLRVSVTDRCNFRCTYCMSENMSFLPKKDVLSFEELNIVINAFIKRGIKKLRLTGGEPLVRRDIMELIKQVSLHKKSSQLEEITLTTNGSQLKRYAAKLVDLGVRRVNVSLDTRDPEKFSEITRRGQLDQVLDGIETARIAGLAVKINMVAMKGFNDHEIVPMIEWAHARGFDLTLIEEMPLGEVSGDRRQRFLPLRQVRDDLENRFTLEKLSLKTGGPARYMRIRETGGRVGFITPMSHSFCESCNRVRLTCTGELYLCLGRENRIDLRTILRQSGESGLNEALDRAMLLKPKGHDFDQRRASPEVARHMSVTGG